MAVVVKTALETFQKNSRFKENKDLEIEAQWIRVY